MGQDVNTYSVNDNNPEDPYYQFFLYMSVEDYCGSRVLEANFAASDGPISTQDL